MYIPEIDEGTEREKKRTLGAMLKNHKKKILGLGGIVALSLGGIAYHVLNQNNYEEDTSENQDGDTDLSNPDNSEPVTVIPPWDLTEFEETHQIGNYNLTHLLVDYSKHPEYDGSKLGLTYMILMDDLKDWSATLSMFMIEPLSHENGSAKSLHINKAGALTYPSSPAGLYLEIPSQDINKTLITTYDDVNNDNDGDGLRDIMKPVDFTLNYGDVMLIYMVGDYGNDVLYIPDFVSGDFHPKSLKPAENSGASLKNNDYRIALLNHKRYGLDDILK